jgi:hypothetical protein
VGLSVSRLSRAFRARPDLQYGIIVAGYFAALGARFAIDPVIHHDWYVYPRFLVGLAMLTLIVSPLCRSWCGTLLSLSSAALVLHHWLG